MTLTPEHAQTWITGSLAADIQTYHKIVTDGGPESYSEWTAPELAEQVADRLKAILDAAREQHATPALTPEHESAIRNLVSRGLPLHPNDHKLLLAELDRVREERDAQAAVIQRLTVQVAKRSNQRNMARGLVDMRTVERDLLVAEVAQLREELAGAREANLILDDFDVVAGDETLNIWCRTCRDYAGRYREGSMSLGELTEAARDHEHKCTPSTEAGA